MSTIICRSCGKKVKVDKRQRLAVCKNVDCQNWNKFALIGGEFFHENYMEEQ